MLFRSVFLIAVMGLSCFWPVAVAGPVPSTGPLPAKIEELETAVQLIHQNKLEDALKSIQEACKKYPALPPAKLILARLVLQIVQQQKGDHRQVRVLLEQAAADAPNNPEVYRTMADLAHAEMRITEVILNAQKILELAEAPLWTAEQKKNHQLFARAALATAFESRGDWANAKTHLAAWLALDPKNGIARSRYAIAIFNDAKDNKPDDAFAEFQQAAKDDATMLPATVMMARQYMLKSDMKKAGEWFEKASKQEANNARVQVAYADYLLQQDNVELAKQHSEQAARLDPKNIEVQRMQGMIARYGRDYATAMRIFQEMLNTSPADHIASNQLALILADMSDEASKKRALQLAEVNARQYQNDLNTLATYGYCLYRNGNVEQAKQLLAKLALNPIGPDVVYYLALTLSEAKETKEEASKMLKKALESNGFFFFKREAKTLNDKLEKELKDMPKEKNK
jgi:tetratricopeptide (TPR) repeat protein